MPFDLNSGEFFILLILAFIILGPKRIQEYTRKGANMVRELRRMADGAKSQLQDEMGPEFSEIDWKKLDPRQYDPRRIVKDVFSEEFTDAVDEFRDVGSAARGDGAPAGEPRRQGLGQRVGQLPAGGRAPFDSEAT